MKIEVLLCWSVLSLLDYTLKRQTFVLIEKLHIIGSCNRDTIPIPKNLINIFTDPSIIIFVESAVLHELNAAILDD